MRTQESSRQVGNHVFLSRWMHFSDNTNIVENFVNFIDIIYSSVNILVMVLSFAYVSTSEFGGKIIFFIQSFENISSQITSNFLSLDGVFDMINEGVNVPTQPTF
jgi:hypothetical protein